MKITKEGLNAFWTKTKKGVKNVASTVSTKTKEAFVKTKDFINVKIDNSKREKELKHQRELEEYREIIESTKAGIDNSDVLAIINDLGSSPYELYRKSVKRIKESFPIPREQTVLWSLFVIETNRTGGITVTDKGVFIKTVVNVFDEKALKKENRKVAELFYYPWEYVDLENFCDDKIADILNSFDPKTVKTFLEACKKQHERSHYRKVAASNHYSHHEQILLGDSVAVSGSMLKDVTKFTRDNGAGNNPQAGFGLFAEQANNMYDLAFFKNAKVVGGNNAKNGPDRLVNGVNIQTKYYRTGARSVGATFDNGGTGNYRYYNPDGTPMKLEVPKGQYESAVKTFRKKIIEGKVPGVTDPNEAENIIVEGHYSMKQVQAMAKAGTIESIIYDVRTGAVMTTCIFGISFLIDSYLCYRKTHDKKEAVISGLCTGGKAGALALITHLLVSQLSRTKTFSSIMTKSVIKSGVVSSVVGFLVFSIPETYRFGMKRISGAQYAANLAVLSASIIGGTAGAYAGAAVGTAAGTAAGMGAGSVPLAIAGGTGGVVGGMAAGTAVGIGASKVVDIFFEGDDKRIARLFNAISYNLFSEYLLDESEVEKFIEKMNKTSDRTFKKLFGDIHASKNQEETIRNFIVPYLEEIVQRRDKYEPELHLLESVI